MEKPDLSLSKTLESIDRTEDSSTHIEFKPMRTPNRNKETHAAIDRVRNELKPKHKDAKSEYGLGDLTVDTAEHAYDLGKVGTKSAYTVGKFGTKTAFKTMKVGFGAAKKGLGLFGRLAKWTYDKLS